jgi:hypothetical protein
VGLEALEPDDFLLHVYSGRPSALRPVVAAMLARYKKAPTTEAELAKVLAKDCPRTMAILAER